MEADTTGKALKCTSLGDGSKGGYIVNAVKALRMAEQRPQVQTNDYEVGLIGMNIVSFLGIWLHNESNDLVIPLPPTYNRINAYQPYPVSEIVKILAPEAKRDAEMWAKLETQRQKDNDAYVKAMMDYEKAHGGKYGPISLYGMRGPFQEETSQVKIFTLMGMSSIYGELDYKVKVTCADNFEDVKEVEILERKIRLEVVRVDSEETNGENGYAANAVDCNPKTFWDTQWKGNSPGLPHEIVIELVPPSVIKGFTYLPRQDESDHGTIKDYEFYVSDNGTNFGQPVKKGAFEPGKDEKIETFDPVKCRFIKLKAISEINGLPWTSAAEIGVIQNDENISAMTNPIIQADNLLAEFERTKSIDQLEAAYVAVGNIPEPGVDKTVPPSVARREKTRMLFKLLAVIDQNIDTNYDNPTNLPAMNLSPPGLGGMRYPSGVDPNDIKEPEIRVQYEVALKQNEEKAARELFQTRLRNIDQSANIFAGNFLRFNYTTSKEDQSELENVMRQARLSLDRMQKIKALFESRKPPGNEVATNLTKQISDILIECQKIKPRMTRADLMTTFTTEGGISTAEQGTFVYRDCPYVKVDVDFSSADPTQKVIVERSTDIISKISKPYLDWSIND
ncbi:MAG: discoidin domain-containing protein [Limisphaerales bacterium]